MPTIQLSLVCLEGVHCSMVGVVYLIYLYFLSTKKIVGVSTVSRHDHGIAQTRELVCTKYVVPQAIARGKCNVCFLSM